MKLKIVVLHCLRAAGVFALFRRLTRSKLRILCYHGFAVGDQHEYDPALYMTPRTFEARLRTLQRLGYPVISLQRGLALLSRNEVANCETVITIDDGWRTTHSLAAPILKSFSFPATIYVTTYYSERGTDVFNVALPYLMWRARPQSVVIADFDPRIDGTYQTPHGAAAIAAAIISRAETHLQAPDRQRLLEYLVAYLGLPHAMTLGQNRFRLMSPPRSRSSPLPVSTSSCTHTGIGCRWTTATRWRARSGTIGKGWKAGSARLRGTFAIRAAGMRNSTRTGCGSWAWSRRQPANTVSTTRPLTPTCCDDYSTAKRFPRSSSRPSCRACAVWCAG